MADQPWIDIPSLGFRVGPMTLTDDQRKRADAAYAKQQALYHQGLTQQQKDIDQSVDPATGRVPLVLTPAQQAVSAGTQPAAAPASIYSPPLPQGPDDREGGGGVMGWLSRMFPDSEWRSPAAAPVDPATIIPEDPKTNTGNVANAVVAAPVAVAAVPVKTDPIQDAIDSLSKYFGDPDQANPKQDKADAYAERDGKRTQLLAQLAFAAGLTKAGGAGWEGVAEGFGNAAGVYDKGFQRYQSALQDSADRYAKNSDQKANRKLAITKAGIDLAQTQAEMERKTWADRMDSIDKMFGSELTAIKGDLGADPNAVADAMKRWQLARNHGEYIPPTKDVASP